MDQGGLTEVVCGTREWVVKVAMEASVYKAIVQKLFNVLKTHVALALLQCIV